jgi:hypothetical protein
MCHAKDVRKAVDLDEKLNFVTSGNYDELMSYLTKFYKDIFYKSIFFSS